MSNYRNDIEFRAEQFKALSNPHRLAVFQRLMTCCPAGTVCNVESAVRYSVSQLGEGMAIAPSTLSHHLKELNRAGLIQMRRNGKQVECWVAPETLIDLSEFFQQSATFSQQAS